MSSACEYAGTQAVGTALGLKAHFVMHQRCYLYSDAACEYVTDSLLRINNPEQDIADDASTASSFSSGIYSSGDSEAASSNSDSQVPHINRKEPSKRTTPSTPELSQDDEFGGNAEQDDLLFSYTDSDVDAQTHQRVETLL